MKHYHKVGDLVKYLPPRGLEFSPHAGKTGVVVEIDRGHFGSKWEVHLDGDIGLNDRLVVLWSNGHLEHIRSQEVEEINEAR